MENNPLQKCMVVSCNKLSQHRLIIEQTNSSGNGPCGAIRNIWKINKGLESVALNGIKRFAGDGNATWLWEDIWIGDKKLMDLFPRLYSISVQHRTSIAECGIWDGSSWVWNFEWQRQFFQWELDSFSQLQKILNQPLMCRNREDQIWWHFDNFGTFSVKSFLNAIHESVDHDIDLRHEN